MPLTRDLENRALTIGMRPDKEEGAVGERMKELTAHLVALQNGEQGGHLPLKAYSPNPSRTRRP